MTNALILIIDPSRETRSMYADYFRHHGYAVAEAADGAEGSRLCRELRPDLIVTELYDEGEWVQAIRVVRNGTARQTAIIACSTLIETWRPWTTAELDIDVALAKPASPRTLLGEVQRLLGPTAAADATLGIETAAAH